MAPVVVSRRRWLMVEYLAQISTGQPGGGPVPVDPSLLVVTHHRSGTAELRVDAFTGGHLLHLAVAGCVYNTIFALASERHVTVRDCVVRAGGGFDGQPPCSTGIAYEIEIAADAPAEELTAIARDADLTATVPNLLRAAAEVLLTDVRARSALPS
jgi:hypothetical protein